MPSPRTECDSKSLRERAKLAFACAATFVVLAGAVAWIMRNEPNARAADDLMLSPVATQQVLPPAAELVEPPAERPAAVTVPSTTSAPATEPPAVPNLAEKYAQVSRERLESALRDKIAAADARAKAVLREKIVRGEAIVVDRGIGTEADLDKPMPEFAGAIAGRITGRSGSTAMELTAVRAGEDPLLDSLRAEADWLREELAGNH